jgi:putative DNA primase/helicase
MAGPRLVWGGPPVPESPQGEAGHDPLLLDSKGRPVPCEANALRILRGDPELSNIYYDRFLQQVCRDGPRGREVWDDDHDTEATEYIQSHYAPKMPVAVVARCARKVARERERDSLTEAVTGGPAWDGTPRIEAWTVKALGCADTPYSRAAGSNFIKALVARALEPGADVHELYILEGAQGIGKTRALRALGGPFYSEITSPIGENDFYREVRGVWLADLAELTQIKRAGVEVVKQILSRGSDRYPEKYEREARTYLRRCVFAGSTNELNYLADSTGNRRFVPLRCGARIDVDLVAAWRDQLIAEALYRVRAGETWYTFPETAQEQADEEREQRRMQDPWEGVVAAWLGGRVETWASQVLSECLEVRACDRTPQHEQRLTRVLRTLGWEQTGVRVRRDGALVRPWRCSAVPATRAGDAGTGEDDGLPF